MMLSIFAVLIVFIAMPVSLALVESWNNAISNEYETYVEFNNQTRQITGSLEALTGSIATTGSVYVHYNSTDASILTEQTIYDKSLFNDSYYRVVLTTSDTTDSATKQDRLLLGLNVTAYDIVAHAANRVKIHIDAGKPVLITLRYQDSTPYGDVIVNSYELNATINYTYTADIDIAKLLSLENTYPNGHFTLQINSYNETEELSPGDVVILSWQFLKKRGAVATIYTVDNLMFGWGFLLFLIGFASTPFFNPLSRDVFPFITKMKRSRAAKKAASKRKKGKKRGLKKGRKKKRRRR